MTATVHPHLDLTVSRIIKAPRSAVWNAWTDPASFEKWWVPEPTICRVQAMDLRPGGSFRTEISEGGGQFGPHITGCFLAVDELERIVFTDALVAGWRPADAAFMTAVIVMRDHPDGTEYTASALHRNVADRDQHEQLGFHDGWGTVTRQLAELVETRY
ncbi:SRPBCC family protein [Mycolicibacterium arenosum]|uniref:SRPBCC family protein n=1 Tax=Mycolicibacterium arenosum TaxID=2952157 RepID=A0ABT1LZ57_9MYCO|nr:SRPBCC family protein [Mycolicibacterium sp. CAU 1645]MCP9272186.1 SRPBCC family protein [Mycolicibacterium sp. CAU 1645]